MTAKVAAGLVNIPACYPQHKKSKKNVGVIHADVLFLLGSQIRRFVDFQRLLIRCVPRAGISVACPQDLLH